MDEKKLLRLSGRSLWLANKIEVWELEAFTVLIWHCFINGSGDSIRLQMRSGLKSLQVFLVMMMAC
jgi:hypothetical protein